MKFVITDNAKNAVIEHLSHSGYLDLCLERDGNYFTVSGKYNCEKIVILEDRISVCDGDSLTLENMKFKLELET
jgi:hypothetical protein